MRCRRLIVVLATRSRLEANRPLGYLTRTLKRLREVTPEDQRIIIMDASPPGETHEELEAFRRQPGSNLTILPRPRPPVSNDEARKLIPPQRLATLPEEEITWGVQITRDFVDLMRLANREQNEFILRLEDDVYAAEDLISSAVRAIERHPNRPFVSLFSPRLRLDGQMTAYHCHAQAIIFRNDANLTELLRYVESLDGQNLFDVLIATFESSSGHRGIVSYPSLVQHLGETRSQPGSPPRERLVSPTFRSGDSWFQKLLSNSQTAALMIWEALQRLLKRTRRDKPS